MPVTGKLSRAFYERPGDQIANELVEWFNQVDLSYRTQLRELNELNFARFDARVGERLAELRSTLRNELAAGFGSAEQRFGAIEARLGRHDQRLENIEQQLEVLKTEVREARVSGVKWTVAFWTPTILALIAVLLRQ